MSDAATMDTSMDTGSDIGHEGGADSFGAGEPESTDDWFGEETLSEEPEDTDDWEPELPPHIQEKLDRFERFAPVLDRFEQVGLSDAQAFEAGLAEREFAAVVGQHQQALYNEYQARVNSGELTPEAAENQFQRELALMNREIQAEQYTRAMADRVAQSEVAQALSVPEAAPLREWGDVGVALVRMVSQSGGVPFAEAAQHLSHALQQHGGRAVASYVAQMAQQGAFGPGAMASGSGGAPPATEGVRGGAESSWSRLLGMR